MLVVKHLEGEHDQKSHGSWATGTVRYRGREVVPGVFEFEYGDMTFSRDTIYGLGDVAEAAISTLSTWHGNFAMRSVSAHMMGIERPPTAGGENVDEQERHAYESGESEGLDDDSRESVEDQIYQTYALMDAVAQSEPTTETLYRGMAVPSDSPVLGMKAGDEFMIPLSAFTWERDMAQRFSEPESRLGPAALPDENDRSMMLRLAPGAKGFAGLGEVVTQGTFKVTKVTTIDGVVYADIEHVDYLDVKENYFAQV